MRAIFNSAMNRLGYYKPEMPEGAEVSQAEVEEMFKTFGSNEMFVRFLRDMCAQDIRLYFQASDEMDRNTLRGAWSRTNYFISLIQKTNEQRKGNTSRARQGSKRNSSNRG